MMAINRATHTSVCVKSRTYKTQNTKNVIKGGGS